MTLRDFDRYQNGKAFAEVYVRTYGVDDAVSATNAIANSPYKAGYVDALLDIVQTREELAPGCYRVRPLKGQD